MDKRKETLDIEKLYRRGMTMQQIGKLCGMSRQAVQQRLAKVGVASSDRPLKHTLIDKERLEFLYTKKKFSLDKIADAFSVKREVIRNALKFHQIPKRDWIKSGGSRLDVLKKLNVGDKCEATFNRKRPHALIYTPAKKLGIKISMRLLDGNKFEITRIG
jgi:predicted DNA-binding protein YlxM (UPF0122 family)